MRLFNKRTVSHSGWRRFLSIPFDHPKIVKITDVMNVSGLVINVLYYSQVGYRAGLGIDLSYHPLHPL